MLWFGIGFVGAGVIFKGDNRVNGITTQAMNLGYCCIGYGYRAGYTLVAVIACGLILVVLYIFTQK